MMLCACSANVQHGSVRLGLGPASLEACEAYCVDQYIVEVRYEGPFGPVVLPWTEPAGCEEEFLLEGLPAGATVFVQASLGEFSSPWWQGQSEITTVVADEVTDVTVTLQSVAPPVIDTLTPDPLVFDDEATLTVTIGGQRFRGGAGNSTVTAAGVPLTVSEWQDSLLALDVPAGTAGGDLVVTACGAWSTPTPLRVLAPTVGSVGLVQPCSAAAVTSLAASASDGWLVGWACADGGDGRLLELTAGGCTVDLGTQLTLAAGPVAIAPARDGLSAWVADQDGTLERVDLATGSTLATLGLGLPVRAGGLAFGGERLFALADTGDLGVLYRLDDSGATLAAVEDVPTGRDVVALAPGEERVFFAMAEGDNGHIGWANDSGEVEDEFLSACGAPNALAVRDGAWAAIACSAGGVAGYSTGTGEDTWTPLDTVPHAVALDRVGDIAFTVAGDELRALDLAAGSELTAWPVPATTEVMSAAVALDHVLMASTDAAAPTLVTPYSTATPCAGGGE